MDKRILIGIGVLAALGIAGYLLFNSKTDTPSANQLPARGQATLANFDDLAKAVPALANQYVYLTSLPYTADKAKAANRTVEMQAKLDALWYYNNNKL